MALMRCVLPERSWRDENGGAGSSYPCWTMAMREELMTTGFTDEGLAALDAALERHTASGAVPGLVALVARGGQVHVTTAGHLALEGGAPIGRDAIFRIASLTKPVTGVAAMLLIQDAAIALDDPVERWLPELRE